jgi:hypothetical protein
MPVAETPPLVDCCPLSVCEPATVAGLVHAFQSATPILLRQGWRDEPEPGFKPATVRTGWSPEALLIFAELDDLDIFNRSTRLNERAWELGDVFEIFLQAEGEQGYVEFHVTPENQRVQLCFAGPCERGHPIEGDAFRSRVWVRPELQKWAVYAEVFAPSVTCRPGSLEGRRWRFSFSRYDYTRGRVAPVLSSSSPHRELSFHRLHEWGSLSFSTRSRTK